jgi:hypothetical protein
MPLLGRSPGCAGVPTDLPVVQPANFELVLTLAS